MTSRASSAAESTSRLTATDGEFGETSDPLRAILAVEPSPQANCCLAEEVPDATDVTRTTSRAARGGSCQGAATVLEDGEPHAKYVSSEVTAACACETISGFQCVVDVESVRDGVLVLSVIVPDRETLGAIVEAVRETGGTVQLERISRHGAVDPGRVELDATAITEKQREAVELAVELGYYETPRKVGLDELADRLGVSKSAVSQRLNGVERTLVRAYI